MKKKKQLEDDESWMEYLFPNVDLPFKQILAMFITYYIITWLIEIIGGFPPGGFFQILMSFVILWVTLTWVVWNIKPLNIKWKL